MFVRRSALRLEPMLLLSRRDYRSVDEREGFGRAQSAQLKRNRDRVWLEACRASKRAAEIIRRARTVTAPVVRACSAARYETASAANVRGEHRRADFRK